jgi:hypothetical protein
MKEQDLKLKIAELKDTIVFLRKELELIKNKNKMENKETLEEAAERLYSGVDRQVDRMLFINGAKWQQERSYSEDDLEEAFKSGMSLQKLSDTDKYEVLYVIWGDENLFEEDEQDALKLAKEKYPNISDEDILDVFYEFLIDNPD